MRQLKISVSKTNRDADQALNKYLTDINRIPMVTIDEEAELAHKIKQGGREGTRAKDRLVEANLRFVVSVAKQYQHQGLALIDLINEGNIGLVKAADRFDETRGFKFISYAVWWIRQSIVQAIAEQSRIVRLPLNQVSDLSIINRTINTFMQEYNRMPSDTEIADMTDIDEAKIRKIRNADGRGVSVDAPIQDGEDGSLIDMMAAGGDSRTDREVDHESMEQDLKDVMRHVLSPKEIKILSYCYGIGCHEKGLEEIGDEMNLTRERVRQIREKSIAKLRGSGNAQILMKYLG